MLTHMLTRVLAAIPLTAITAYVARYTELLHTRWLTHPDWAPTVNESITPFGVIAVLLAFMLLYSLGKRWLRWISIALLTLTAILMLDCYWYHATIDDIAKPDAIEAAITRWSRVYVAACTAMVTAATAIGLWFTAEAS
jgi:hypothetical protein